MKWTDYTTKETLEDNDELMILDADVKANKRTLMSKIWNYVVDKMTSAVVAKLTTTDKTVLGAINELNSNKQKVLKSIGKQFNVDNKRVITTDIKRTAIIIACRSNGALIAPFVTSDSDTWKAKVDRLNGDNVASVYVTFFYFE